MDEEPFEAEIIVRSVDKELVGDIVTELKNLFKGMLNGSVEDIEKNDKWHFKGIIRF